MTVTQSGMIGAMHSPIDTTYLADNVILFRFFEARGQVRRAVSVVKNGTAAASTSSPFANWKSMSKAFKSANRWPTSKASLPASPQLHRQAIGSPQETRRWPIKSRPTKFRVLLLPPTRRDADAIGKKLLKHARIEYAT